MQNAVREQEFLFQLPAHGKNKTVLTKFFEIWKFCISLSQKCVTGKLWFQDFYTILIKTTNRNNYIFEWMTNVFTIVGIWKRYFNAITIFKIFFETSVCFFAPTRSSFYLSVIFLDDCNLKGDPELECSQYVYKTFFWNT